jgi:uncharacterized protein (TIGR02145 family)
MKTITILVLIISTVAKLYSQSFELDFAGTGAATVVDSVKVENLNQGTSLTLKGTDVLMLNIIPSGINNSAPEIKTIQVYPNPMTEMSEIQFSMQESGNVLVAVCDMSGRIVLQSNSFLVPGTHRYSIRGLTPGMYVIRIKGQDFLYSAKLVSQNSLKEKAKITYASSNSLQLNQIRDNQLKSANSGIEMVYDDGDRLKLTGMSGNFSTVFTIVPEDDITITFNFVECTDADSNYYPTVEIGTQIFMAVNLETTHYSDGTPIPLVTENESWFGLTSPAYCWYDNDSATYKDLYGALYNWWATDTLSNSGKNICPSGWHVPSDAEWTVLANYLGGENIAGNKLKETGTMHWNSPNTGATNETGFTMPGTGWRYGNGEFHDIGIYNCLWSTTGNNDEQAYYRELDYNQSYFLKYPWYKRCGFSVRCVKDE